MHKAWRDTKELDLLGHLRSTKAGYTEEWFAARKRTFTRRRSAYGGSETYVEAET